MAMVALIAALPFSLVSCGSDDDDGEISSGIVGTWKGLSTSGFGVVINYESYMQFKSDGTWAGASCDEEDGFRVSYGKWYQKDNFLYITEALDFNIEEDEGLTEDMTIPFRIVKMEGKTMTVEFLGVTSTAVKVADSEMKEFIKKYEGTSSPSAGQLSVNGTIWESSSDHPIVFGGFGNDSYHKYYYGFNTSFYKKPASWSQVAWPDCIGFDFRSNFLGNGEYVEIKEGMDITNTKNFNWEKDCSSGTCCNVVISQNVFQVNEKEPWVHGTYTQVVSGHAYIKKIEKGKTLTIQFDNLKLKLEEGYDNSYLTEGYKNTTPETITLKGTVTYTYKKGCC